MIQLAGENTRSEIAHKAGVSTPDGTVIPEGFKSIESPCRRFDGSEDEMIDDVHKELAQKDDGIIAPEVSHVQNLYDDLPRASESRCSQG